MKQRITALIKGKRWAQTEGAYASVECFAAGRSRKTGAAQVEERASCRRIERFRPFVTLTEAAPSEQLGEGSGRAPPADRLARLELHDLSGNDSSGRKQ